MHSGAADTAKRNTHAHGDAGTAYVAQFILPERVRAGVLRLPTAGLGGVLFGAKLVPPFERLRSGGSGAGGLRLGNTRCVVQVCREYRDAIIYAASNLTRLRYTQDIPGIFFPFFSIFRVLQRCCAVGSAVFVCVSLLLFFFYVNNTLIPRLQTMACKPVGSLRVHCGSPGADLLLVTSCG